MPNCLKFLIAQSLVFLIFSLNFATSYNYHKIPSRYQITKELITNIINILKGQLSKYTINLIKSHIKMIRIIIQYLKRIMELGLVYSKKIDKTFHRNSSLCSFLCYANNSFIGSLEDQKLVIN